MPNPDSPYRLSENPATLALFAEAERQLNICNSCRYCEGYCAVYPALERRNELTPGDIVYLANLCHDCRACLYACMYAPPHEFGVNPPEILAKVRRNSYASFARPKISSPNQDRRPGGSRRVALGILLLVGALALTLVGFEHGLSVLGRRSSPVGSPYPVLSYATLLGVSLLFASGTLVVLVISARNYWQRTRGTSFGLWHLQPWKRALSDAATLRYLRGGAEGCYTKPGHASAERRISHYLVSYGFLLCLVATMAAAIEEDLLGVRVPFPLLSVPVGAGLVGGIGLVIGSLGIYRIRAGEDAIATDGPMTRMDRSFLVALFGLGASGLVCLLFRSSSAYGLLLVIHLIIVWTTFLLAPYTKFVHFVFRVLALVKDHVERSLETSGG